MAVRLLDQDTQSDIFKWTIQTLYQYHKDNLFFYDREKLQRLLVEWAKIKTDSYLYTLFNGASYKDQFQIADIQAIVNDLESVLNPKNKKRYAFIKDNLDYFQDLLNQGHKYLVIDGQHRIHAIANFIDNNHSFDPEEIMAFQKDDENGSLYLQGLWEDINQEIKEWMLNTTVSVVIYSKGNLSKLANVFITSNESTPMTKHEKRMVQYNSLNRMLTEECYHDPVIKKFFQLFKSAFSTGQHDLKHKGDTLFCAEMLLYTHKNDYQGIKTNSYDPELLDNMLGDNPTEYVSKTGIDLHKQTMKIMAQGCIDIFTDKEANKFTRSSLYNYYYTISFLLQKGNIWSKQKGFEFDGQYSIENPAGLAKWFFDEENKRLNHKDNFITIKNSSGKEVKQTHNFSYRKHNEDQKHSSKESTKKEGGSKYTFTDWARVRYLLNDLKSSLSKLETRGYIKKLGNRTNTIVSRETILVEENIPLFEQKNYEIDEKEPVSKGGKREFGNVEVLLIKDNRIKGARSTKGKKAA
jgi:hypothetical protein